MIGSILYCPYISSHLGQENHYLLVLLYCEGNYRVEFLSYDLLLIYQNWRKLGYKINPPVQGDIYHND
jgi:hypothetical protein